MNLAVRELSVPVVRAFVWTAREKESEAIRRRRALRRFDNELEKGNYKAAHSLLKQLQHKPRGLLGFGSVKLVVPKRIPTQELHMDNSASFESLADSILRSIKHSIEFARVDEDVLLTGIEDSMGSENYDPPYEDHQMCLQHEAGHFLVGYLVGVLPRSYQVPNVEDIIHDKFAQGNVQFLGFEFLKQVDIDTISSKKFTQGKEIRANISSRTLNKFLCVILGGLVAEHLVFGYSELLHSDVQQLDRVLRWLCFNENEADSVIRWAVITTLSLLCHHHGARSRLAEAMNSRRSIGYCIDAIESAL
ncbi:PREDICTED: uncharacterized protein LOC109219472 isoform X2 [Nicotiana attenuata]|uniref:Uncharacterized protein n=1 Tax=Nicotiana attenuata TaxID=49451 RepID=A0A1J6JX11_NICAT|nr:PREDICTED: uncharacterized protein LOC109219472 isoform X2 [Nicotiana attenuata]OIT20988.1 hypothetical protein A4A49_39525 [Nicotiana attenuata]